MSSSYFEKSIDILASAIEKHNKAIDELESSIVLLDVNNSSMVDEINSIKDSLRKEFNSSIRSHIENIKLPKDGKDAVVDYDHISSVIDFYVSKIKPPEVDYDKINSFVTKEVSAIPTPKDGVDGINAKDGVDGKDAVIDYQVLTESVMENFPKTEIVEDVKSSIPKQKEVVGIEDISMKGEDLTIKTTDGKSQKFKMSFKTIQMFGKGGGGHKKSTTSSNIFTNNTITEDSTLVDSHYLTFVDASNGDIAITLPVASGQNGRVINIKRIDNVLNSVTVSVEEGSLIEDTAQLNISNFENIQLMCNGLNWYVI